MNSTVGPLVNTTIPTVTTTPLPNGLIVARRFARYNNMYIIPAICSFGIVTNLICCVIFLLPKFKLKIYRLLFWKSFFHLAGLLIQVFTPIITSPIANTLATTIYRWQFRTWIYNAFCMAALLCNLAVSFDRLIMISKKCNCFMSQIPEIILVAVFFVFSLACFFFPFFAYYPENPPGDPKGYYELSYTDWGNSIGFVKVRVAMFGLRDIILWFLFVVVNAVLLYEARKIFRRKAMLTGAHTVKPSQAPMETSKQTDEATTNNNVSTVAKTTEAATTSGKPKTKNMSARAERRMTNMTVVMSAVLAFGQMPYFINIILYAAYYGNLTNYKSGIVVNLNHLAFDTLYASFAVSVFIYYFFDKNFKSVIDELVKRAFRCN